VIRREIRTVGTLKSHSQPKGSAKTFIVLGPQALEEQVQTIITINTIGAIHLSRLKVV